MEKKQLTLGSLFDGSGEFMLAARNAGIKPLWASELAPFPTAVTRKNFPEVKHCGGIRKLKGDELEPVDIITGGSHFMTELEKNDVVEVKYFEDGHEKTCTGLVELDV